MGTNAPLKTDRPDPCSTRQDDVRDVTGLSSFDAEENPRRSREAWSTRGSRLHPKTAALKGFERHTDRCDIQRFADRLCRHSTFRPLGGRRRFDASTQLFVNGEAPA